MDKKTMIKLIEDRAKGEKARVLFDMLMDTLGCDYEMKQHEVFLKLKEAVEGEQEAIKILMQGQLSEVQRSSDDLPEEVARRMGVGIDEEEERPQAGLYGDERDSVSLSN